jgi:hypothetical protein
MRERIKRHVGQPGGRRGSELTQIRTLAALRNHCKARPSIHKGRLGDQPTFKGGYSESATVLYSPEIIEDDMQVGIRGRRPIQVGINDPSTSIDGRRVPEVVRCFENDPGRIQGLVPLRLIGNHTRAFA